MNKKRLSGLCLILLIFLISGCMSFDGLHISGRVVDQNGKAVAGIKVVCNGTSDVTDKWGKFNFSHANVETPRDIKISFSGANLGFESSERTIRIYPDTDKNIGDVTLERVKAFIYGTVEVDSSLLPNSVELLNSEEVKLPQQTKPEYAEGEIIVKFKEGIITTQSVTLLSQSMGLELMDTFSESKFVTFKTDQDTLETIEELKKRPDVEFAEPNYYIYPLNTATPQGYIPYCNDPYFDDQWNLQAINLVNAWKSRGNGSSSVIVAVLDTGIQHHSDLDHNILWELGKDYVDNDDDPSTWFDSHGTQVASIIGAIPNNYQGIAGINEDVSIVPIRILQYTNNDGAWGKTTDLLKGLDYAIYTANADIINLSVAIDTPWYEMDSVNEMIQLAEDAGVLIVAAAGNDGDSEPTYPARHSYVLSVGAVGPTLQPTSYTNRGVDIYAPGGDYYLYPVGIQNTIITLNSWAQGTSLASAHVAGVAALILANENLSPAELRSRLKNTSLKLAYDENHNPGLIDAFRAVTNQEHSRIFVFVGEENWNSASYMSEESTYTYNQDGEDYFEIATVEPGARHIYAWIDWDNSGTLSSDDLFDHKFLYLEEGDEKYVQFDLSRY